MSGRLINGIKYMYINDDNNFKKKSFEDNVYFTLRDIFWNSDSPDTSYKSTEFNDLLTGGICFEERTDKFKYTNVLHEKAYVEHLQRWLKQFNHYYFEFRELEEGETIIIDEYIKFDEWWVQFKNLINLIDAQLTKFRFEDLLNLIDEQKETLNRFN